MINRYERRAPLNFRLSKPPLELAAQALESAQKKYDTNFNDALKAKQVMINALPGDQATANEFRKKYSTRIDDALSKANGDYSQITQTIQELKMDLANDLAPGTKYSQVVKNYNDFNEWKKQAQEDKDNDPNDVTGYTNYFLKNYKPVGDPDPVRGYESLNLPRVPKFKDWMAEAEKSMSALKPEDFVRNVETVDGRGRKIRQELKTSGVTADRAYKVGLSSLMGDPVMRNNLQFKSMYTGIPVEELYKEYASKLADRAQGLSYMSDERGNRIDTDQAYWNALSDQRSRQSLDWDKIKHAMEHPDLYQPQDNSLSRTGAVDIPHTTLADANITLAKALSPQGQEVEKSRSEAWNSATPGHLFPGGLGDVIYGPLSKFAKGAMDWTTGGTKTITPDNIYDQPGVNGPLLKKIVESKLGNQTYDPSNKDHVRAIQEAQFEYDQNVKNADSRNVNIVKFGNTNSKAVGETAFRLLSAGATKATSEWDKSTNALPEWMAGVSKDLRKQFANGSIKPTDVHAVGIIPASQGVGQGHTVELVVKGETILMQLDDVATDPITKSVADAYSSVFNAQKDGGLIPTGLARSNGSMIYAQPTLDYKKENGKWTSVNDLKLFDYDPKTDEYYPIDKKSVQAPGGVPIDYQFILDNVENSAMQKSMPRIKGADKLGPDVYPH